MKELTLNEFESKIMFELDATTDQKGTIRIIKLSNNELLGTFDIEGKNLQELKEKTQKCKIDHYNVISRLLRYDEMEVESFFKSLLN